METKFLLLLFSDNPYVTYYLDRYSFPVNSRVSRIVTTDNVV